MRESMAFLGGARLLACSAAGRRQHGSRRWRRRLAPRQLLSLFVVSGGCCRLFGTATEAPGRVFAPFLPSTVWSRRSRLEGSGGEELIEALRREGAVAVELSDEERASLDAALQGFGAVGRFRYPPQGLPGEDPVPLDKDGHPIMPDSYRQSFNVLYAVAASAAFAMLGRRGGSRFPPPLACVDGKAPFQGDAGPWPYSSSFFNIFNYNHGMLNSHRDRGVLTAVYGTGGRAENMPAFETGTSQPSSLWLKLPAHTGGHRWSNAVPGQLLLWAGSGLNDLVAQSEHEAKERIMSIEDIMHCVRADPEGAPIPMDCSICERDPESPEGGNRQSIALVLDE
eukprot:TRINITY_DN41750_c0_g1_i1.p1 TRINITY_DN41750_c0_g1~~TRINITY_DN41750_c0_g1_i1.p1  ORF type:complete len:339 (+),score=33.50 TRINITY_DN41750_c0_g1_i1:344-1360(+)